MNNPRLVDINELQLDIISAACTPATLRGWHLYEFFECHIWAGSRVLAFSRVPIMGASTSNLKRLVKEEYNRLSKGRGYLVLDDVLEFQLSLSGWRLDPAHVGVLLAIDRWVQLPALAVAVNRYSSKTQRHGGRVAQCFVEHSVFARRMMLLNTNSWYLQTAYNYS